LDPGKEGWKGEESTLLSNEGAAINSEGTCQLLFVAGKRRRNPPYEVVYYALKSGMVRFEWGAAVALRSAGGR
jgi:hypothetical protein